MVWLAASVVYSHLLPGLHHNQHHPLTPCNSIDPTRLDPQEIERVRQAGSSKTVDPNALAKSLSKIHVQENGRETGQSGQSATESNAARVRTIEEKLRSQRFDVFLSFAEEDQDFAEEVRHRIVSKLKLRVFVPSEGEFVNLSHVVCHTHPLSPSPINTLSLSLSLSPSHSISIPPFHLFSYMYQWFSLSTDLMPDKVFHREIADMITNGCRKTIVILSPDYVRSPWCNYEANLVINRSPGITTIHM